MLKFGLAKASGPSLLFVCLGNICRSPIAEMLARQHLAQCKAIRSAGTRAVGGPIDSRAAAALARRELKAEKRFRSRQFETADFERYDLILALDSQNLADLREMCPEQHRGKLRLLLDYAPGLEGQDVPDPYYGPAAGFDHALMLIERGISGLGAALRAERIGAPVSS
ncbi:low molecular weight protein-tyrosine-phosphatase [Roseateles violae]|uniref:protein-tyrosine-phosphatase n=1 Tax=Roseateles violae TaxID=3058042 RepID=A0ABT8DNZ8_9BURK|nr:low molecular weight protein-tyrosine-phosphatase [Pelomonas sp. PFR6]MDN3919698.1 low molecular weight protein-tyrosine-phosphatase [Pelomonas sp. PFR6]